MINKPGALLQRLPTQDVVFLPGWEPKLGRSMPGGLAAIYLEWGPNLKSPFSLQRIQGGEAREQLMKGPRKPVQLVPTSQEKKREEKKNQGAANRKRPKK